MYIRMHLPSLERHPVNSAAKQTGFRALINMLNSKRVVLMGSQISVMSLDYSVHISLQIIVNYSVRHAAVLIFDFLCLNQYKFLFAQSLRVKIAFNFLMRHNL